MVRKCWRAATSGTMPPKRACISTCVATTFEWMFLPSSMTAAAVSSQDVSMPRIFMASILAGGGLAVLAAFRLMGYNKGGAQA